MASDNIVSFKTVPVTTPGPDAEVIETLERLLGLAKAGELNSIAYATTAPNGDQSTGWTGARGTRHPLGTGIMMLHSRFAEALRERS